MTDEELTILSFLRVSPATFYSRREIARKAVRRKLFEENPRWADAPLVSLLAKKQIHQNENGQYCLRKDEVLTAATGTR
jgi:hypothetical protein